MEELDLLALRFPSRVPVRFHVIEPDGSRVSGGPWAAQGLDVSRTGVRLEASDLPPALLKKIGDWEANLRMEVSFEGIDLPVVGVCRWLKDFGAARWILGVEYVPADKSRGTAIASHFERRYLRPKAVRMASYFGSAFVLFAALLVYTAWQRQQVAVARAEAELDSAIEEKASLAILISELESRLARAPTDGASPELAREIVALRAELENARGEIGKKSLALADADRRPDVASRARPLVQRGNRFFSDGNMSGARAEYEKAREVYSRIKVGPAGTTAGLDPFARGKLANMHAEIAQAYHDAGLIREAVREYEKGVGLCPHFADLQTKLGTLLRELNDLVSARKAYEAAIQAKPNYVPARLQLGVVLLSLGEPSAAEEHWKHVISLEPENSQAKMYLRMLERTRSVPPQAPGG